MDERYDEKGNLKESFIDKRTGIEYNLVGDYYLPNLVLEAEEKVILNKYGLLRLNYLKEHKKADYIIMFMNKTLNKHLKEIQETAKARVDTLIKEFAKQDNIDEELKAKNQLEWVQMMNNCKNRAEEIVFSELIYI
ncbi:MAG: TnpV protein [Clostridia bacterium]|nr:TnpV protein [Clostridia bacterium]